MLALLVAVALAAAPAQSRSGSISGRVDGGAARRGAVALLDAARGGQPVARTRVDAEGRYRFDGLGAGRYVVAPIAPGYVMAGLDEDHGVDGRPIVLSDGEQLGGVDVALVRGGVITGRVTDPDGRAVVGERIELMRVGADGSEQFAYETPQHMQMQQTDDRGVYRIYGLTPGRYLVAAGEETLGDSSMYRPGEPVRYRRAFHPKAESAEAAVPVEVTSGGEASGVDVVVARAARPYSASGRVVEAATGKPVAGIRVGYQVSIEDEDGSGYSRTSMAERTNERGEFSLDNLPAGTYGAIAGGSDDGWISDPLPFTIGDGPVSGLQIRVRRGARIAGHVVVEGTADPTVLRQLVGLTILTHTSGPGVDGSSSAQVQSDGGFLVVGIRPGAVQFNLGGFHESPTPFTLVRVEREGAPLTGPLEVEPGEELDGIRVVVGYGTGKIRGRVEVVGGELPKGASLHASVRRASPDRRVGTSVDVRGQFLVENLLPGEYEVEARVVVPGKRPLRSTPVAVTVTNDAETPVTVRLDLGQRGAP